jgi:glycosyltransferase involved in cell wall biosynthesis
VDHVVVIDDGSPDDLQQVLTTVPRRNLVSIRHERNLGLAAAMRTGFRRALEIGDDIVVKMDGDGQMDPAHLGALLTPIAAGRADATKGNRFFHLDSSASMPIVRRIGNLALSFMTKLASGYWNVFDPTNGYVAVHRTVLTSMNLNRLGPGYFFEISLLGELYLGSAVVKDVAMPARYGDEQSSLHLGRVMIDFPLHLIRISLRRFIVRYVVRDFTPVALLTMAGAMLVLVGGSYGLIRWYENIGAQSPLPAGTVVLGVVPMLAGIQMLLQALVMDINNVPSEPCHTQKAERLRWL